MNLGGTRQLLPRSKSDGVGKRYAAQNRPLNHDMTAYLVLTACVAYGLLVCAKEVTLLL